ncbi:hypothetical protein Tco_1508726 [Tanacetum coccineum]
MNEHVGQKSLVHKMTKFQMAKRWCFVDDLQNVKITMSEYSSRNKAQPREIKGSLQHIQQEESHENEELPAKVNKARGAMIHWESIIEESTLKIWGLITLWGQFEFALIALIPSGIVEADFDPKGDIRFIENLMYDNSFPRPTKTLKDDSETVIDSNNDYSSSDNDSLYSDDIDYVEASPPDTDILLTIEDDILREKLLNVNLLIAKIEALKDNPTPSSDFVTKSSSTSLNFFLEETNIFDNSLPESEFFALI